MEEPKAKTTYIAIEITQDGYAFERLWTCKPEHEHPTPSAAQCLYSEKCGSVYAGVGCLRSVATVYRPAY